MMINPHTLRPDDTNADSADDLKHASLSAAEKVAVLIEALPWLEEFSGQRLVIKYGGNAMINEQLQRCFAEDMAFLHRVGIHPIIVHGGGPQISSMLTSLGITPEFKAGLRVTDKNTMDVVRMVLTGKVSRQLIGLINQHGPWAVGLSGEDGGLLSAHKRLPVIEGTPTDIGMVGDISGVNPSTVNEIIEAGKIPVISSIAPDEHDPTQVLNINADYAAAALAIALKVRKLIILTDVEGVYADWPDQQTLISKMGMADLQRLLPQMHSGMQPKMEACLQALQGGVPQVHIIDGRRPHTLLNEIFTHSGIGTMVVKEPGVLYRQPDHNFALRNDG
ncbi:acetylglutamate kinase [Neisseriaceae bacterium ESL0693]|nr:acetylglutamate kinase [Neisseriaceae bacterium ESL0693]